MRALRRAAGLVVIAAIAVWLGWALAVAGLVAPLTVQPAGPVRAVRFAPGAAVPHVRHVFVIVMENRSATAILSGRGDPYLRALARRYVTATAFYATTHPSLPNYLALLAGHTFGIRSDAASPDLHARTLVDSLAAAGVSFGAYMEGLPQAGSLTGSFLPDLYAGKHDPFRYFVAIRRRRAWRRRIQPLAALWQPLARGTPPAFTWITPNLCHDMHTCPTLAGDAWLRIVVPRILASPAWRQGGVLFIVWDEGNGLSPGAPGHGGRVALFVVAPGLRAGAHITAPNDDYGLLRTVEDALGVRCVGRSCTTPPLDLRSVAAFGTGHGA